MCSGFRSRRIGPEREQHREWSRVSAHRVRVFGRQVQQRAGREAGPRAVELKFALAGKDLHDRAAFAAVPGEFLTFGEGKEHDAQFGRLQHGAADDAGGRGLHGGDYYLTGTPVTMPKDSPPFECERSDGDVPAAPPENNRLQRRTTTLRHDDATTFLDL